MPRRPGPNDVLLRNQWGRWFTSALESLPSTCAARNRHGRVVDRRVADAIGGVPASRVGAWKRSAEAPLDADVTFRVGNALSRLGAPEVLAPIAVLAAGCTVEFLRYLRAFGDRSPCEAVELYAEAPLLCGIIKTDCIESRVMAQAMRDSIIRAGLDATHEKLETASFLPRNYGRTKYRSKIIELAGYKIGLPPEGLFERFRSPEVEENSRAAWRDRGQATSSHKRPDVRYEIVEAAIQLCERLSTVPHDEMLQLVWHVMGSWASKVSPDDLVCEETLVRLFVDDPFQDARFGFTQDMVRAAKAAQG